MKPTSALRSFLLGSSLLATSPALRAADLYWDGTSASWNTSTNWSTASNSTTPNPAAVPNLEDTAIFNISTVDGNQSITLDANQAVKGLTFENTGTTTLLGGGTARTLTLGTGGITIASGAGAVTLGDGSVNNNVIISLSSGAQAWNNSTATALTLNNTTAPITRVTGSTLNFATGAYDLGTTQQLLPNSILGNWAFHGTGAGMKYTTRDASGVVSAYTAATSQTFSTSNNVATNFTTALVETIGINANRAANTLHYTGAGATYDYNNTGTVSWLYTVNGILATGASGTLTFQRAGGTSNTSMMRIGDTNELVIAGQQNVTFNQLGISGATASTGALTYSGTGTLGLTSSSAQSASTYGGGTTINSGTVTLLGSTATLGASTGSLTMNGGILNMTTVNNLTVGRLNGVGGTINITNARTLTVNQTTAGTYDGVIAGAGGAFTLGASSTNKLTLTGNSTYTGATTVAEGTLAVNGSLGNTSTTIQSGGTLQGSGTIGGSVTVENGGFLAPGNSIESLGTGTLTLDAGSTFAYELNKDAATANESGDLAFITGNLNIDLTNAAILTLTELGTGAGTWDLNEKLTLLSYTGTWNGGLFTYGDTLTNGETFSFSGANWQINYDDTFEGANYTGNSTGKYVTLTVIPEPGAALLGSLGMLALLRRRRY